MSETQSPAALLIFDYLRSVYPASRTTRDLDWWIDFDAIRKPELKDARASEACKELKRKGLVEYIDPYGWKATPNGVKL